MGLISDFLNEAKRAAPTPYQASIAAAAGAANPPPYQEVNTPPAPAPVQPAGPSYRQSIAAAAQAASPAPYQEVRQPMSGSPVAMPSLPSVGMPAPGSALDPLGNVRGDVAAEYNRGAQASPATAVGMGAREAIVSPVSRVLGPVMDAGRSAAGAVVNAGKSVYEAGRAFVTGTPPAPAAAPAPARAPLVSVAARPVQAPAANGNGTQAAGAGPISSAATAQPARGVPRRVSLVNFEEQTPVSDLHQAPVVDPTQQILALQNNGTWSGMINARTLAKRVDADRAAAAAAANAAANTISAFASDRNSRASAMKAGADVEKSGAETGVLQQQALSAQYEQQKKQQVDSLTREMTDPKTTPQRRKQIEEQLVVIHGKSPAKAQTHTTPIYDATGQKVGENIFERQADGTWKNVTPKTNLRDNPQAMAIVNDTQMKDEDKRAKLKAMGYQ